MQGSPSCRLPSAPSFRCPCFWEAQIHWQGLELLLSIFPILFHLYLFLSNFLFLPVILIDVCSNEFCVTNLLSLLHLLLLKDKVLLEKRDCSAPSLTWGQYYIFLPPRHSTIFQCEHGEE
uniref:Uncharacterized protein n=1 Tax=Setaria italica TaxID=4555 RepID=K3XTH9_SETIT